MLRIKHICCKCERINLKCKEHIFDTAILEIFFYLRAITNIIHNCSNAGYINAGIKVKLVNFLLKPQQIIKQDR